jgi:hypothetical protein
MKKALNVRSVLSISPLAFCILGALLVSFPFCLGCGFDIPAAGSEVRTSPGQIPPGRAGTAAGAPPTEVHAAQRQTPTPSVSLPVLTRAVQVRQLTPEQATLGYSVHLTGVVTYSHPDAKQDCTGLSATAPDAAKLSLALASRRTFPPQRSGGLNPGTPVPLLGELIQAMSVMKEDGEDPRESPCDHLDLTLQRRVTAPRRGLKCGASPRPASGLGCRSEACRLQ